MQCLLFQRFFITSLVCDLSYLKEFAWRHASQTAFCSPALGSVIFAFPPRQQQEKSVHVTIFSTVTYSDPLPRALLSEYAKPCYLR